MNSASRANGLHFLKYQTDLSDEDVVAARVENPYDGYTLAEQMKQVDHLIGDKVREVHGDMGYRGHNYVGNAMIQVDKRQRGRTPKALWKRMKRRAAVEPSIGHLKNEHRLERNRLKGVAGDAINAILSAAAMNFQKLLRTCERKLVAEIRAILGRLQHQSLFPGFLIAFTTA
jgi:IS5 family transposase